MIYAYVCDYTKYGTLALCGLHNRTDVELLKNLTSNHFEVVFARIFDSKFWDTYM